MRGRKAKKVRDNALETAKFSGHDPLLLVRSGAMEVWVCKNCDDILDAWDRPAVVNGRMPYTRCSKANRGRLHSLYLGTLLIISNCFRRLLRLKFQEGDSAL